MGVPGLHVTDVVGLLADQRSIHSIARPSGRDIALPFRRAERAAFLGYVAYLLDGAPRPQHLSVRQKRYVHLGLRDGSFGCYLCHTFCPPWDWTQDHLLPVSRGGLSMDVNLKITCSPCNAAKGNRTPGEYRAALRALESSQAATAV
jgi:hypothetical protein